MIASLDIIQDKRHKFIKLLTSRFPAKTEAFVKVYDEIPITGITQRVNNKGVDWKRIKRMTDADTWLFPKGMKGCRKYNIMPYMPKLLPFKLLENFALSVLVSAQISPSKLCVGVTDECLGRLEDLVEMAGRVCIHTEKNIELIREELLDRYGAAVAVGNSEEMFLKCNTVIAPKGLPRCRTNKGSVVFADGGTGHYLDVRQVCVAPDEVFNELAVRYGGLNVMSVLCEVGNRREYLEIIPNEAVTSRNIMSAESAAAMLTKCVSEG